MFDDSFALSLNTQLAHQFERMCHAVTSRGITLEAGCVTKSGQPAAYRTGFAKHRPMTMQVFLSLLERRTFFVCEFTGVRNAPHASIRIGFTASGWRVALANLDEAPDGERAAVCSLVDFTTDKNLTEDQAFALIARITEHWDTPT
ncbi:MAG: hypothetical protein Q7R83_00850 [bacterium]|nr:hypothetical protein [bacterium]